jgi:hypothetical protein
VQHRGEMCGRCITVVLFALALTFKQAVVQAADTGGLQLEWHAPAGCPDHAETVSRVPEAPPALAAHGPGPRARGVIVQQADGYRLNLWTDQGSRTLFAKDCEELASAAVLVLSLLIDAQRHGGVRVPPPTNERVVWPWIRPEVVSDLGTLPHLAVGPGLGLGVRIERLSLGLSGNWLPKQDVRSTLRTAAVGQLQLWSAELHACYALTDRLALSPCVHAEYGRIIGRGRNLAMQSPVDGPWLLAGVGLQASAELWPRVHALIELACGVPLQGAKFSIEPLGTVHRTGAVVGRLRAGLELRL